MKTSLLQCHDKEYVHGQLAVEAARMCGIFPNENMSWAVQNRDEIILATEDRIVNLRQWQ
jgi:hypothetical protein